jgi:hypothetical protein
MKLITLIQKPSEATDKINNHDNTLHIIHPVRNPMSLILPR